MLLRIKNQMQQVRNALQLRLYSSEEKIENILSQYQSENK